MKITAFRKLPLHQKGCDFNVLIFLILLSRRWIKSINLSSYNIIHHRQNLSEFILSFCLHRDEQYSITEECDSPHNVLNYFPSEKYLWVYARNMHV
jgi:hypothetical protein